MKRSVTFSQKEMEQLASHKAREAMPNAGGTLTVATMIRPGVDDRMTYTPTTFEIVVTFDDEKGGGA